MQTFFQHVYKTVLRRQHSLNKQ